MAHPEPPTPKLRVAVAGAGPAGLYVAIGLARLGHDAVVYERLAHPIVRGTVNRDRSYPVDITGAISPRHMTSNINTYL
jgi:2-polyprenyl-6-methoxyphenol hydroxylase-like FAD-dependent oxidoreductase